MQDNPSPKASGSSVLPLLASPLVIVFILSPHPLTSKRRIRKAKKAVEGEEGEFVMQSDLNEVFVGPVFDFTVGIGHLDKGPAGFVSACLAAGGD